MPNAFFHGSSSKTVILTPISGAPSSIFMVSSIPTGTVCLPILKSVLPAKPNSTPSLFISILKENWTLAGNCTKPPIFGRKVGSAALAVNDGCGGLPSNSESRMFGFMPAVSCILLSLPPRNLIASCPELRGRA